MNGAVVADSSAGNSGASEAAPSSDLNSRIGADDKEQISNLLKQVRDSAIIGTVYLYFVGFTYYYEYADTFGIPFDLNSKPVYQLIVYSYGVLADHWPEIILTLICFFGLYIAASALLARSIIPEGRRVIARRLLVGIFAIALFPILSNLAYAEADDVTRAIRDGIDVQLIKIIFKENKKIYGKSFLASNENYNLVLLAENTDNYFILLQDPSKEAKPPPLGHIKGRTYYHLPQGYVFAVRKAYVQTIVNRLDEDYYYAPTPTATP